jgi:hypothetical protein
MIRTFLLNGPLKTVLGIFFFTLLFRPAAHSQCPVPLPVAQGFNSTSIPACWFQQYVSGNSDLLYVSNSSTPSTSPEEGSDYVNWPSFTTSAPAGAETRIVSPAIITTGTPSVDVNFWWYNENSFSYNSGNYLNEGIELQYSLDSITWIDIQFYARQDNSFTAGTGGWKNKVITLPAAAANQPVLYVGFKFHSEYGDNCSLDNVHIVASPACAGGPSAIVATSLAPYSAIVNWTAPGSIPAGGYNWRVVAAGDSVNGLAIDSGNSNASTDSALITGLAASTYYDFYVQSNCGGLAGVGYWMGPLTFLTPCVSITTLPWTEGFEGLGSNVGTDLLPPCWYGTPSGRWNSADGPLGFPTNMQAHTGTNYIFDRYNALDTIFTPGFSLTAGITYEFYYYFQTDGYQGWDSIKTMCGQAQNAGGMTINIGSPIYSPTNLNYVKFVGQFTPTTSATYYFGVNLNASFNPDDLAFDDFGLKIAPACAGLVSNEAASNLTSSSADLSWTPAVPAPANGYNWELVATGDSVNGTVLFSGTTAAGITSVNLNALAANTSYDLYVQTNCGIVGVGDWTGPLTFVTPCSAITSLPWHEGFESLGSNVGTDILPPCWLGTPRLEWTSEDNILTFPAVGPRTGSNYLFDNGYNVNDTIFTPGFALTGGIQYEFYFYYQTDGSTTDSIFSMYGNYQNSASMTTLIGPVVFTPTNTAYMKYSAIFTPATSGTYYFGTKLSSQFDPDIAFDDFGLQEVIPCPNPPHPGTIAGPAGVCSGNTASYTLTGYSPYTVLQWQISSDSINFTDISGANQDYINTTISALTYLRVKVLCADSTYSPIFTVGINPPVYCYCSNVGGYCGSDNIDTVAILNTSLFVSDPSCAYNSYGAAYTQFPDSGSATTTLQRRGNYTISVYLQYATVSGAWIDFDQDGVYESYEFIPITSYASNGTAIFTVPDTAVLGLTGMRVRTNYSFGSILPTNACTHFYDGETFDFLINIADTICSFAPTVVDTVTNVTCNGSATGAIALGISGTQAPYTSLWSTGDMTPSISHLLAGRYADTIGFHYGCRYIWTTDTVAQPAKILGNIDSVDAVKCFGQTGSIYQTPIGGFPGYTNHWNTGDITPSLINKVAGTYADTITDTRGCKVVIVDTLPGPLSGLSIAIDSVRPVACNGQTNGAIFISVTGGSLPYRYNWSDGTHGANLFNAPYGQYTLNVIDTNGCTASASDSVPQPNVLVIVTDSVVNSKCHNENDGSIYVTVTGGTLDYQYQWTSGIPTYNLYLVPAGTYTLTITDARNCSVTATNTITSPPALTLSSNITSQISGGSLGTITTTVGGGVPGYTYLWSDGETTSSISNLVAGVYSVSVTDQNGCIVVQRDTVNFITSILNISDDVRNFNIYPNPSNGVFNVLVDLSHTVPVQIEVYTITGQLLDVSVQSGSNNSIYIIDMTDQPDGVYLVKLIAGDNTLTRRITLVK